MCGTQQCCCADSSVVEGSGVLGCVAVLLDPDVSVERSVLETSVTADLVTVHRTLEVLGPEPYN
jgi:hypothetical protein